MIQNRIQNSKTDLTKIVTMLGTIVLFFWVLEGVDWLFLGGRLDYFGIHPRTLTGLRNILFSPFLHNGFGHLFSNSLPFFILGAFVYIRGANDFFYVSLVTTLVSGLGIWFFGAATTVHLGASGVVFGYLGYLLTRSYFERSIQSIVLAIVAFIIYGGMLWGVLPIQSGVSWLGHLFGLIGGGLAAYWLVQRRR